MRYGMAIDLRRCVGCQTCAIACKMSNNLPKDMMWLKVKDQSGTTLDVATGEGKNLSMQYTPVNCMHCENPACVTACPTGATYKREDGIVAIDTDKCIGCRTCITACPYTDVRQYNAKEPEYQVDFALGAADAPVHKYNTVSKCTLCAGRVGRDEVPYCVEACPARARIFGDLDDPNSEISKVIASRETMRLLEEKGTEPNVYYLV